MGGLNYVVTVLQGRARGMTLMRMPLDDLGHLHRDGHGAARLPGPLRRLPS